MGVGVMASAVHIVAATCTDVITHEQFNDYTTNSWTTTSSPPIVTGRTGTAAQTIGTSDRADYDIATINQSDTITIGLAFRWTDANSISRHVVQFWSDSGTTQHNRLTIAATGECTFTRGSTALVSSATGLFVANTWYYIEIQAKLHDTAGTVIVRRNGVEVINANTLDTRNAGTKTVYDQIRICGEQTLATNEYDDLYLSTGTACAFQGDINPPVPYPAIATSITESGTSLGTNQTVEPPTGITAGDLLVCFVSHDGGGPIALHATATGWTQVLHTAVATTVHCSGVFARIANGTASAGNDTLAIAGGSTDYCAYYARITGHGVTNVTTDIRFGSVTGTTGNANPPSLNVGDSRKWLWFASAAVDTNASTTLTAVPASYTQVANVAAFPGDTASSILAVATRELEASTTDPGTFTNTSRNWVAATVAIPPDDDVTYSTYTYEEGTDGATVTAATGIDQVTGTPTFEADAAVHGSMGLALSGASQHVRYAVPATADHSGSVYLSPTNNPGSGSNTVLTFGTTANSTNANVRFHSDGTIQITDATNALIDTASTTTWAAGNDFRFDWQFDESGSGPYTGQVSLRIFKGANAEGTTADEEMVRSVPSYVNGPSNRVRLRTATAGWTVHFDTLRLSATLQWLGPYA